MKINTPRTTTEGTAKGIRTFLRDGASIIGEIGEIDFESEIPLFEGFTLSIGACLETAGGDDSSFSVGWTYEL